MTISIDTSSGGYNYPGGFHENRNQSYDNRILESKLVSIWNKRESINDSALYNSELTDRIRKVTELPDLSTMVINKMSHNLNHEKVVSLIK